MNKSIIIPKTLTLIQLFSIIHLFYIHKYGSTQFPADLIELNIFAVFNLAFLIVFYFLKLKIENKTSIWILPLIIAIATILLLVVVYIVMLCYKYE